MIFIRFYSDLTRILGLGGFRSLGGALTPARGWGRGDQGPQGAPGLGSALDWLNLAWLGLIGIGFGCMWLIGLACSTTILQ